MTDDELRERVMGWKKVGPWGEHKAVCADGWDTRTAQEHFANDDAPFPDQKTVDFDRFVLRQNAADLATNQDAALDLAQAACAKYELTLDITCVWSGPKSPLIQARLHSAYDRRTPTPHMGAVERPATISGALRAVVVRYVKYRKGAM